MPKTYEEKKKIILQRYHDNRFQINEKQKKYFREIYYVKNREKLVESQRQYRAYNNRIQKNVMHNVIIERNNTVYF